jgi:hypothetical protein
MSIRLDRFKQRDKIYTRVYDHTHTQTDTYAIHEVIKRYELFDFIYTFLSCAIDTRILATVSKATSTSNFDYHVIRYFTTITHTFLRRRGQRVRILRRRFTRI